LHLGKLGGRGVQKLSLQSNSILVTLNGSQRFSSPIATDAVTYVGAS
jgi:hypothetical protein